MKMTTAQKLSVYGDILNKFEDPVVKKIVEGVISKTPIIFFGASTSSSGKYHPKATNGLMGLVKHSIAVMLTAEDLLRNETITAAIGLPELTQLDKEVILAACLLHDNAKYGAECNPGQQEKLYTETAHPRLVGEIAKNAELNLNNEEEVILNKILLLIETHMGQWNQVKYGKEADLTIPETPEQVFVHTCDYIASRKVLDIVSELSLPDNLDPKVIDWYKSQT